MAGLVQLGEHWGEITTLVIFLATYAGLALGHWFWFKLDRCGIALLGGIAMLALGCITLPQAVAAVNMESILLLFALMVIASQLRYAGFYRRVAELISGSLLDHPARFLGVLIGAGGLLSAFLNNDVVVLALAPVIIPPLLRKRLNPVPFLIALALASNVGCALTTIGNAQNVLVGQLAGLSFGRYLGFAAPPVLLGLGTTYSVVYILGRKDFRLREPALELPGSAVAEMPFNRWRTTKGLGVLLILVVLFVVTPLPHYLVAMTGAGLLLCSRMLPSRNVLNDVNWQLLVLFIGLFVVVGAFSNSGLADRLLPELERWGVDLNHPPELAVVTGILSNCINNSAAVMLLVKVVDLSDPLNGYTLALANAFAGNLLLMGSLANVIVAECAEQFKLRLGFREFARYGIPTALLSLGVLLLWIGVLSGLR